MKRLWRGLMVVVGVVFLLVLLLPWLASMGPVRAKVLALASARSPGEVDADSWRLRWLRGQTVAGLSYRQDDGTQVRIAEVRLERGLLALARNPYRLGRVEIVEPDIRVALPGPAADMPSAAEAPLKPIEDPIAARPALPDLYATVVVEGGRIGLVPPEGDSMAVMEDLDSEVVVAGIDNPIRIQGSFRDPESGGQQTLSGSVTVGRELRPTEWIADLALEVADLDLTRIVSLAAADGLPTISGRLEGTMSVRGSFVPGIHVLATLKAPAVSLSGGMLGQDTPQVGDVILHLSTVVSSEHLVVSNLMFRTGFALATVSGRVGADTDGTLKLNATVDGAELLTQLPETLGLRPGMVLEEGNLGLRSTLERSGETFEFSAEAKLARLAGTHDGRAIAWDSPTSMAVAGSMTGSSFTLDRLVVESSVVTLAGSGTPEAFRLEADADLAAVLAEVGKFLALDEWSAAGALATEVDVMAGTSGWYQAEWSLSGDDVHLAHADVEWIPRGEIGLNMEGRFRAPDATSGLAAEDLSLSWRSRMATGRVAAARLDLPPAATAGLPSATGIEESMRVDLGDVNRLLHALQLLDPDMDLEGTAVTASKASFVDDVLEVSEADLILRDFQYRQGDRSLKEDALRLRFAGRLDPRTQTLQAPGLTVQWSAGSFQAVNVVVRGGDPTPALKTEIRGQLDLARMAETLGGFLPLPETADVAGQATVDLVVAIEEDSPARLTAEMVLDDLRVRVSDELTLEEDRISLALVAELDGALQSATLQSLVLTSTPVSVQTAASVRRQGQRGDLTADGEWALDLERLAPYLNAFLGTDLVLKGREPSPFHLASYWVGPDDPNRLAQTTFSGGVSAESIQAFGLDIQHLSLPAGLSNGVARVDVTGGVNHGQLNVHPVVDLRQKPASLVLHQPTNLLVNVRMTEALANELLARILPVFQGATGLEGVMDLAMDEFAWPLDPNALNEARFSGTMTFRDLHLQTSGLLFRILEAAKVKEREISVPTRQVRFVCRNGRIEASPMQIDIKGHNIVIAGSVGLDQSLTYTAEIPVTEDLVGRDAYRYLADTTLRLPIRGTVQQPDLGIHVLQEAARDLARQALKNAAQDAIQDKAGQLLQDLFR